MSAVVSTSAGRRHGLTRVCRVWGIARSGVHRRRRAAAAPSAPRRRPGPSGPMPDAALVEAAQWVLIDSPFHGPRAIARSGRGCATGACAPPRSACGAFVGKSVHWTDLRSSSLRENALPAASRVGRSRGPRHHDGTIIPDRIDALWDEPSSAIGPRTMANDMTAAVTTEHGQVAVFVAVDHLSAECTGIHAARRGTRHEALEPIRQGVVERFGALAQDVAQGLSIRHDHGSQYMSHDFQREVAWLGAASSPAFVRAPLRATAAPRGSSGP